MRDSTVREDFNAIKALAPEAWRCIGQYITQAEIEQMLIDAEREDCNIHVVMHRIFRRLDQFVVRGEP